MTSGAVGGGVIHPHQLRDILWPCPFLLRRERPKQVIQGPVKSLTLAISLGVVCCPPRVFNPVKSAELSDKVHSQNSSLGQSESV